MSDQDEPDIAEVLSVAQDVRESAAAANTQFSDGAYLPGLADTLQSAAEELESAKRSVETIADDLHDADGSFEAAGEELQQTIGAAEFLCEMLEQLEERQDIADESAVEGRLEIGGESFDVTVTQSDDADAEGSDEPFNVWLAREMVERGLDAATVAEQAELSTDVVRRYVTGEMEPSDEKQRRLRNAVRNFVPDDADSQEDKGLGELFG